MSIERIKKLERRVAHLFKREGQGGEGTVFSVSGSSVDNTNPTAPIIKEASATSAGVVNLINLQALGIRDKLINNIRVGKGGLNGDNVSNSCTVLGFEALTNITGIGNTAIGTWTLRYGTTTAYNTAVGSNCMAAYIGAGTNDQNTAVGSFSLYSATTGIKNTVVGASAMQNGNGSNNTAIGWHALEAGSGSSNIGVGFYAGRGTSGSNNILIENIASGGVTSGSGNIILNGRNASGITTGNNNVVIGGFSGLTNTTDTMYFGTGAGVLRFVVNSVGNFGIGTTATVADSAQLEVTSTTKGFLPPRMTTTQKNAIVTPVEGLSVYDSTLKKLCVYTGAAWETITSV